MDIFFTNEIFFAVGSLTQQILIFNYFQCKKCVHYKYNILNGNVCDQKQNELQLLWVHLANASLAGELIKSQYYL